MPGLHATQLLAEGAEEYLPVLQVVHADRAPEPVPAVPLGQGAQCLHMHPEPCMAVHG